MIDWAKDFEALRSKVMRTQDARLSLNGQHMILLPRHFFRYILREVKATAGEDRFNTIFSRAGREGAKAFCRRFQQFHGCSQEAAVRGYFHEMSLRGWGQFSIQQLAPGEGRMEVILEHSALREEGDLPSGHVIWTYAALGAMEFLQESTRNSVENPVQVRSEETSNGCRILISRNPTKAGGHEQQH